MEFNFYPSACSLAIFIVLEQSGIEDPNLQNEAENAFADSKREGFPFTPKFMQTLMCENFTSLTEVPVIIQMIAHFAPQANLAPQVGTGEHFKLQNWMSFISNEVYSHFILFSTPDLSNDSREKSMSRLRNSFNVLETHLQSSDYLMTRSRYSIADAYLFAVLKLAESYKINLSEWNELSHYKDFLSKQPAYQRAMARLKMV